MKKLQEIIEQKPYMGWVVFIVTVIVVFLLGLFASSIIERQGEASMLQVVIPLNNFEPRNEVWGKNYPREFESYLGTLDTSFKSKYCGSAMKDYLAEDPELVVLWAGYAFSQQYNQGRGHYHSIEDIRNILRTTAPQPATCWTCKSPDVPRMMNKMGVKEFYSSKWMDLGSEIYNPIGCQDCHDPKTMNLHISRPALVEAFSRQGRNIAGATHQEMRSLVCAQCHVEYYFKGDGKYLVFPWDKGMNADSIEQYYDNYKFSDWTHALSRAPMLKAQHPDYELFSTGIHSDRGISCADCHMPYRSEGGVKFTNHKIQSPLNDISGSCQICHRESEDELRENVYKIQDAFSDIKKDLQTTIAKLHIEAKFAWDMGAGSQEMEPVLKLIRHAQWRWDYVSASNSYGFHSPSEVLRLLSTSYSRAYEARLIIARILAKHNYNNSVPQPDISTKSKAQEYIGLRIQEIKKLKAEFLKNVVPQWEEKARARQLSMNK